VRTHRRCRQRSWHCRPNPFTPDGDGRDDLLTASLEVPHGCRGFRARVYDLEGRCRARIAADRLGPGPRQFVWDGRDDNHSDLPSGLYILSLEFDAPSGPPQRLRRVLGIRRPWKPTAMLLGLVLATAARRGESTSTPERWAAAASGRSGDSNLRPVVPIRAAAASDSASIWRASMSASYLELRHCICSAAFRRSPSRSP
jgi:hypothetical protein